MKKWVVATSNQGKLREIQAYLTEFAIAWQLKPTDLEVEETGTTFLENACLKAAEVAKVVGEWAIADDSGLSVTALNGAPGVYSARYGDTDQERIDRVLRELGTNSQRQAHFICAIALARPDGTIALTAEGKCEGEILTEPRGSGGFGYDPIFYVPELQKTFAELPPQVKHEQSHRGRAFAALLPQLRSLIDKG